MPSKNQRWFSTNGAGRKRQRTKKQARVQAIQIPSFRQPEFVPDCAPPPLHDSGCLMPVVEPLYRRIQPRQDVGPLGNRENLGVRALMFERDRQRFVQGCGGRH